MSACTAAGSSPAEPNAVFGSSKSPGKSVLMFLLRFAIVGVKFGAIAG
jgi:hypothetical protein